MGSPDFGIHNWYPPFLEFDPPILEFDPSIFELTNLYHSVLEFYEFQNRGTNSKIKGSNSKIGGSNQSQIHGGVGRLPPPFLRQETPTIELEILSYPKICKKNFAVAQKLWILLGVQ